VASEEGRQLLSEAGVDGSRLPVAMDFTGHVVINLSNAALISLLGVLTTPSRKRYDVAVISAGPAGLADGDVH
jgi:thioredoxin reductase (NADPH)